MTSKKKIGLIALFSGIIIVFCLFYPIYKEGDTGWSCNIDKSCNSPHDGCLLVQEPGDTYTVCINLE